MGRQVISQADIEGFLANRSAQRPVGGGSVVFGGGLASAPPPPVSPSVTAPDSGAAAPTPAIESAISPGTKPDSFQDRLLKYIPVEVVTTFVFLDGLVSVANGKLPVIALRWAIFFALLVGTWFYLSRVQHVSKSKQLAISTIAFAVWVFSLGGPFTAFSWYSPVYGATLLPLYTFFVPIVEV
jgi:hypothetical protein